jgi:hypothetical protein
MKNIQKNFKYLCCLSAPGDMCKSMVNTAGKNLICAICECIQNVMNGNVKITKSMLNKLKPHKNVEKLQITAEKRNISNSISNTSRSRLRIYNEEQQESLSLKVYLIRIDIYSKFTILRETSYKR